MQADASFDFADFARFNSDAMLPKLIRREALDTAALRRMRKLSRPPQSKDVNRIDTVLGRHDGKPKEGDA
jgi:hypothetical protein